MAQIDGKLLVHRDEPAGRIVNLLYEPSRVFAQIDFFDIARASTHAAGVLTKIAAAAILQVFPRFEFSFVLSTRSHCKSGYHTICG